MFINIQPIEKRTNINDGHDLEVHSIFYTIQGEGPFAGRPAVFIRLAGCNLQCPGCDTDYTRTRKLMCVDDVINNVRGVFVASRYQAHARGLDFKRRLLVVITGGEPFRQNLVELIMGLCLLRLYDVQIETNGTLAPYNQEFFETKFATIVCSPKTGKIHPKLEPIIDAYKYVLSADSVDPDDGLPVLALSHTASPRVARPRAGFTGPVYVQPMDSGNEGANRRNLGAVIDSAMRYNYIVCLQIHKVIGME